MARHNSIMTYKDIQESIKLISEELIKSHDQGDNNSAYIRFYKLIAELEDVDRELKHLKMVVRMFKEGSHG